MTVIVCNGNAEFYAKNSVSPKIMMIYLLDESTSLEGALVATRRTEIQRSLRWRAVASHRSSGGVTMAGLGGLSMTYRLVILLYMFEVYRMN